MPTCKACDRRKTKAEFREGRTTCRKCETAQINRRRRTRARRVRAKVFEYLRENPCVDCGEADIAVLEFDHRCRTTKEDRVSALVCTGYGWDKIKVEIDKCDVRCANCHRRRTAIQLGWYAAGAARTKRA
jgi:hypothetical protein